MAALGDPRHLARDLFCAARDLPALLRVEQVVERDRDRAQVAPLGVVRRPRSRAPRPPPRRPRARRAGRRSRRSARCRARRRTSGRRRRGARPPRPRRPGSRAAGPMRPRAARAPPRCALARRARRSPARARARAPDRASTPGARAAPNGSETRTKPAASAADANRCMRAPSPRSRLVQMRVRRGIGGRGRRRGDPQRRAAGRARSASARMRGPVGARALATGASGCAPWLQQVQSAQVGSQLPSGRSSGHVAAQTSSAAARGNDQRLADEEREQQREREPHDRDL